jgi:hypothetical protein
MRISFQGKAGRLPKLKKNRPGLKNFEGSINPLAERNPEKITVQAKKRGIFLNLYAQI